MTAWHPGMNLHKALVMRSLTTVALLALLLPVSVVAQPRLMAGAGLSSPLGDFGDAADVGWHVTGGLQLDIPTLPVGIRADGRYHSFGQATDLPSVSMLSGALSVVIHLPGVGIVPYLLGGLGMYRTSVDVDGQDPVSDPGFQGAFGVDIGALGFGGFAEVRFVNVNGESQDSRFVTATLGLRL